MTQQVNFFKDMDKKKLMKIVNYISIYVPPTVMSDILDTNHKDIKSRPAQALDNDLLEVKFENVFDRKLLEPDEKRICIKLISDFDDGSLLNRILKEKRNTVETIETHEREYKFEDLEEISIFL